MARVVVFVMMSVCVKGKEVRGGRRSYIEETSKVACDCRVQTLLGAPQLRLQQLTGCMRQ